MEAEKIYFDLDGVLADFDRGVHELCGIDSPVHRDDQGFDDREMWDAIRRIEHFYDKLDLMEGAKELFDELYARYGDRCEILSGIPKPRRGITTAGEDKTQWVRRMLSEDVRVNIVYWEEKADFCSGPDCILIDDKDTNIRAWRDIGGTGILHTGPASTRAILEEMGLL